MMIDENPTVRAPQAAQAPASHRRGARPSLMYVMAILASVHAKLTPRRMAVYRDSAGSRNYPPLHRRRKKFKGWQRELRRRAA